MCYHHQLDLAGKEFTSTRDLKLFVKRCESVCQGTLDMKRIVRNELLKRKLIKKRVR